MLADNRKLALAAPPASEEWFRMMVENSRDGINLFDLEMERYIFVSPAQVQLTGFSEGELYEMSAEEFWERVHPLDRELTASLQSRMAAGQEVGEVEYRWKVKSGEFRWFSDSRKVIPGTEGRAAAVVGIIRDITDEKRVEAELEKTRAAAKVASRAKSEFLAMMNHEIRTPVTIFMAATQHLLELDQDPERRLLLVMAEQSAQHLCSLIDDILDFSRIEARRIELEQVSFDLRACIGEAVDMFAFRAQEKGLQLEMDVSPDVPETIVGDPHKLRRVMIILTGNAVKFTRVGEIRIGVQSCGDFLEFSVADTGIGIPEGKFNLLFQSFSQVDGSSTRKFDGAGLGLAISKGLVEFMGGKIWVRKREGEGSLFTFTLPLKNTERKNLGPTEVPTKGKG
jgi:PAS domain S-box-containing protein